MKLSYFFDDIKFLVQSEKTSSFPSNKYCFLVNKSCIKSDLFFLFKKLFGVSVLQINLSNSKSELKKSRSRYKKIFVTLKKGDSINF